MSKTVTIPTDGGNPFVVILGGVKYVYKPGETVEVPDGVALEIEEWERWHEKYYGENVPPFGAQPDLSQNDPTAADYVKNRTHYVEKAFKDITWDGDTEGLDAGLTTQPNMNWYKVSDQIPTAADLLGAILHRFDGEIIEITEKDLRQNTEEVLTCHYPSVIIVYAPTTYVDTTYPSAGVYFFNAPTLGYTHSLKAKETVHKLDPKYLPDDIGGKKYDIVLSVNTRPGENILVSYVTISEGSIEAVRNAMIEGRIPKAKIIFNNGVQINGDRATGYIAEIDNVSVRLYGGYTYIGCVVAEYTHKDRLCSYAFGFDEGGTPISSKSYITALSLYE